MSKSQRTKGAAGEREAAAKLRELGWRAERTARNGVPGAFDLDTALGPVEVKRRGKKLPASLLYDALDQSLARIVMFRMDGRGWLVVMTPEQLKRLTKGGLYEPSEA